jgi:hypothetical protein
VVVPDCRDVILPGEKREWPTCMTRLVEQQTTRKHPACAVGASKTDQLRKSCLDWTELVRPLREALIELGDQKRERRRECPLLSGGNESCNSQPLTQPRLRQCDAAWNSSRVFNLPTSEWAFISTVSANSPALPKRQSICGAEGVQLGRRYQGR